MPNLFSDATSHPGSVPMSLVKEAEIVAEKQLLDVQEYKQGRSVTQVRVRLADGQERTWYAFSYWWASFDDADNETWVFEREDIARWHYGFFALPFSAEAVQKYPYLTGVRPFTVRVEYRDKPSRQQSYAQHPSGRLGKVMGHGLLYPVWVSHKLQAIGRLEELKAIQDDPTYDRLSAWNDPALVACMLQLGDNGEGMRVVDVEAERQQNKLVRFNHAWCWETGIHYFVLGERVPEDVFKALLRDAGLFYHKEELEEEGNWKAWCTTDNIRAAEVLARFGWEATGL